jgi:hypothetical protein
METSHFPLTFRLTSFWPQYGTFSDARQDRGVSPTCASVRPFAKLGDTFEKGTPPMKVFCVGLFRTGTTTMCEMFEKSFRAGHEFQIDDEFKIVEKRIAGALTDEQLRAFVRDRDAARPLDLDASGIHFGLIDILVAEFPEAKFILTVRDVYTWMNSCVGKLYADFAKGWIGPASVFANRLECLPDLTFLIHDRTGYKNCLEPMMKAWTAINRHLMRLIPADRLLVVNTENLGESSAEIAAFCGIDEALLESRHSNPGPGANFLRCFDPERLEELVHRHCGELMAERYPGVTFEDYANHEWSVEGPSCADLLRFFSLDEFCPLEPLEAVADAG